MILPKAYLEVHFFVKSLFVINVCLKPWLVWLKDEQGSKYQRTEETSIQINDYW